MNKPDTTQATDRPASVTITLKVPLKIGNKAVPEFNLRRPRAGDLRGVKLYDLLQSDVESLAKVTGRISEPMVSEQAVYDMDPLDIAELANQMSAFFVTPETS